MCTQWPGFERVRLQTILRHARALKCTPMQLADISQFCNAIGQRLPSKSRASPSVRVGPAHAAMGASLHRQKRWSSMLLLRCRGQDWPSVDTLYIYIIQFPLRYSQEARWSDGESVPQGPLRGLASCGRIAARIEPVFGTIRLAKHPLTACSTQGNCCLEISHAESALRPRLHRQPGNASS